MAVEKENKHNARRTSSVQSHGNTGRKSSISGKRNAGVPSLVNSSRLAGRKSLAPSTNNVASKSLTCSRHVSQPATRPTQNVSSTKTVFKLGGNVAQQKTVPAKRSVTTTQSSRLSLISKVIDTKSKPIAKDNSVTTTRTSARKSLAFGMKAKVPGKKMNNSGVCVTTRNTVVIRAVSNNATTTRAQPPIKLASQPVVSKPIPPKRRSMFSQPDHLPPSNHVTSTPAVRTPVIPKKKIKVKHVKSRIDTGLSNFKNAVPAPKNTPAKSASIPVKPLWNSTTKMTENHNRFSFSTRKSNAGTRISSGGNRAFTASTPNVSSIQIAYVSPIPRKSPRTSILKDLSTNGQVASSELKERAEGSFRAKTKQRRSILKTPGINTNTSNVFGY